LCAFDIHAHHWHLFEKMVGHSIYSLFNTADETTKKKNIDFFSWGREVAFIINGLRELAVI
jgi:hypothetical protein